MHLPEKINNRLIVLVIILLFIITIGYLDYLTGTELSFSFFYLIPISLVSFYNRSTIFSVLISSILASLLWFLAEYFGRDYSIVFFPIWNAFVRLTIFTSIGLLIFYIKQKHRQLELINKSLKVINEEKNKFIGITAHDIRNPISGIYSFSDLLIVNYKDNINPEVLEILQLIRTVSSNTLTVLQNLLDISKIESGKVELKYTNQDYISFVKHQIFLNQIIAKYKSIAILFQPQIDSFMMYFDEHYLGEVIDNLLSNAIKYSYSNSEIVVKISLLDNQTILTEVVDKGKGIPETEQQKLFNYYQTTSTRPTEGEQSTGLGLAITKRIVKLHNGEIGLKSDLNHGSTFYFTLPIKNNM